MEIIIGSENPTKISAVKEIFPTASVTAMAADSGVPAQPFSDEETKHGAVNRAFQCAKSVPEAMGIGLEGGVMHVANQLYLCNWGALVTSEGKVLTASGARIALPDEIEAGLSDGIELGILMDQFAKKQEVSKNEGAIGIFTNDLVTRMEMFAHVVKLLRGQWEYLLRK
ncbi:DUF84 family protein [Oceanobacillus massiliensis]|uniref:DUF84 family protein n=1 Tax=Oceanobacillus massiliensis TaxID=1465765 RepID=UPI000288FD99|nr:DUF84 family protein [Oceanobacillus massiliensis]